MEPIKFAVTTSQNQAPALVNLARQIAQDLGAPYIGRGGRPLEAISTALGVEGMVVVSSQKVLFVSSKGEFFFHPGLARLRIKELKNGKTDQMIEAMSVNPGNTVLDCTLGLGADAVVASFVTGKNGRVVGLESSPVIAFLVKAGLASYPEACRDIAAAMQRVEVIREDHREYLGKLSPGSFDIVYFDPMFRFPRQQSPSINAMRNLAEPGPLDRETISLASRIAVRRVVVKERRGSAEFERLGIKKICGGRYAPVAYGVMDGQGVFK
ncbi:MAG: Ribosomal RNA small subunit methyltransferase J [Pelotomaculum sp. PtaU1.Bin035]|nr:MAG: Ribosomal RNA small subunit methyltransferase J [Pelotomaculum sp. PtaU1.Bin035]